MERAPTPHGEAETSGSTLMMQHMSGSTMMQLQASGSNLTLEKKTSTGIMPDEEDLQSVPDESKRPRRLRSRWACYCCGTWSAIGIVLLLVGIAALVGYLIAKKYSDLACGFSSLGMCSAVFVSNRDPNTMYNGEFRVAGVSIEAYTNVDINQDSSSVFSKDKLGIEQHNSIYLGKELGCQIDQGSNNVRPTYTPDPDYPFVPFEWSDATSTSDDKFPEVNYTQLDAAVHGSVDYLNDPVNVRLNGARAVAIIYKGKLVSEGYANYLAMSENSKLLGWSMTKSVNSAIAGLRVLDGKMNINDIMAVPQWSAEKLVANNITMNDYLQMSSGLKWDESYDLMSDVTRMLYSKSDPVGYVVSDKFKQEAKPGTRWYYSSATSNIISQAIRLTFKDEGGDEAYWAYPFNRLFNAIGADFTYQTDNTGTFVASSFAYATARDWAKFGQLYLQDGVWNGKRILPEGWVNYSVTPAPASGGNYGAQWWLNPYAIEGQPGMFVDEGRDWLSVMPKDTYFCSGHDGQNVIVIPSKQLVMVRLSYAPDDYDRVTFWGDIVNSFPDVPATPETTSTDPSTTTPAPAAASTASAKPTATTTAHRSTASAEPTVATTSTPASTAAPSPSP